MNNLPKLSKESFEKIIKESYTMIYNLGLRLFNYNKQDAEDFVQDVYLQIYEKYDTFLKKSKINTWIYSVALHLGLSKIKKNQKFKEILKEKTNEIQETLMFEKEAFQDVSEEQKSRVQMLLSELPEMYRLPIILFYYEKLSYKEMSEKLKIPEGTLKSLVYRGKLLLRDKLLKTKEFNQEKKDGTQDY